MMDKDYVAIAVLVVISTIAVLATRVYFGNVVAGLTTIVATILIVGKCLLVFKATVKQEKNARSRKGDFEDNSFAPVGRMSQFP